MQFHIEGTSPPCQVICCAQDLPDLWAGVPVHSFLPHVWQVRLLYWEFRGFTCTQLSSMAPLSPEGVILTCLHKSNQLLTSAQVETNPLVIVSFLKSTPLRKGAQRKALPCLLKAVWCASAAAFSTQLPLRDAWGELSLPSGMQPLHPSLLPESQQNVLLHWSGCEGARWMGSDGKKLGTLRWTLTSKFLACLPFCIFFWVTWPSPYRAGRVCIPKVGFWTLLKAQGLWPQNPVEDLSNSFSTFPC